MPLYEMTGQRLNAIPATTFTALHLLERDHIQKAVQTHIVAITPGIRTMVLAEEYGDFDGSSRRIDLLCLDAEARLVVVELKRDKGIHMELQALRYAAMVSTMRFDQAVEAHREYLLDTSSAADPEQAIRTFLGKEDGPVALSETVRIVLAAAEFSPELTTAVLWLNKQGLDLRCVQLRPHKVDDRIIVDIQQVIPLPEAAEYQVAVREKSMEQAAAIATQKDMTRYDVYRGDELVFPNLPKRRLVYVIVAEALSRGVSIDAIVEAVPSKGKGMFLSAEGDLNEQAFGAEFVDVALPRYFAKEEFLFRAYGRTYALSNQWGIGTIEAVDAVIELIKGDPLVTYAPTTESDDEVSFGEYVILRRGTKITMERNGKPVSIVMPELRKLAEELGVSTVPNGTAPLTTQRLGARVMRVIKEREDAKSE
ncbi:hypothetical protein LJR029_004949 [Caballeronia sp. LjRoot29]|uniref:hypothetical protein n=1 Tax=Caballeronia sp. LjRoot29 TaxID=3342315 RepID=UPI003ED10213